ncbi:GNAT family N-acetyltransferase [Streptomyces sp. NPDC008238]
MRSPGPAPTRRTRQSGTDGAVRGRREARRRMRASRACSRRPPGCACAASAPTTRRPWPPTAPIPPSPGTRAGANRSPRRAADLVAAFAAGDPAEPGWFQYAVELVAGGELIGDIGVCLHDNRMQAELGFTLARAHQGHGYAAEAVTTLLDRLFTECGLHRVSAECDARNSASARLLERVGFRLEGRRPAHSWIKGEWTDDLLFGLLADGWERRHPRSGPGGG